MTLDPNFPFMGAGYAHMGYRCFLQHMTLVKSVYLGHCCLQEIMQLMLKPLNLEVFPVIKAFFDFQAGVAKLLQLLDKFAASHIAGNEHDQVQKMHRRCSLKPARSGVAHINNVMTSSSN